MAPPRDERSPFERLADSWYGEQTGSGSSYGDFWRSFIQTNPQEANRLLGSSWNADLPSQLSGFSNLPGIGRVVGSPTEPIGYIRFNTGPGNETKDAVFTVLANNIGIDNAIRASMAREEGDYGTWAKELATGSIEAYLTFRSTGGQVVSRTTAKGISGIVNAVRRAEVTSVTRGTPVYERALRQLGGELGAVRDLTTAYTPIAINTARTGARGITTLPGRTLDAVADISSRFSNAGFGGTAKAVGRRLAPSRLPGGRFGALVGLLGAGAAVSQMLPGSQSAATATENKTDTTTKTTPTRTLVPRGDGTTEAEAANNARVNIAGINQQYNNILRELQSMYQLSETDEERERLRFMLADIEAQRDAGLQAISEGYAKTVGEIREQAVLSGERTAERAQRYGQDLEESADRAAQRMMLQNAQQQAQFRGLGSGSQSAVNEWVGLMSSLAPAQQLYTQRMGDISQEGMEWIANTVGGQGQAQSADLQRLAAATRSGAIASQQAQVSDRINRERELQRAAILQTMQQRAGALQSAEQFNASLGKSSPTAIDRANTIQTLALAGRTPEYIRQYFATGSLGALDPSEFALAQAGRDAWLADPNNS
jgi:hypothetical protein